MIPPPPGDDRGGILLYSTVSVYGAAFLGLNLILLSVLVVFDMDTYQVLTREDALFENLTALLFFLTALLLGAIAAMGRGIPGSMVTTIRDIVGNFPLSLVRDQYLLLLFFAAYAFFSRERRLFTLSAVFFAAIVSNLSFVNSLMSSHISSGRGASTCSVSPASSMPANFS